MTPIMPYVGVVFPFMGSLSLHCYHFYFLMTEGNANISVAIEFGSTAAYLPYIGRNVSNRLLVLMKTMAAAAALRLLTDSGISDPGELALNFLSRAPRDRPEQLQQVRRSESCRPGVALSWPALRWPAAGSRDTSRRPGGSKSVVVSS